MSEPHCAARAPYMRDLPAGDYWWCACGLSKTQPFCDGSHKAGAFTPVKFTIAARRGGEPETVWLCGCKRSRRKPFCDGSHNQLPAGLP
jgi:CDGSH-type Zn-finger protein